MNERADAHIHLFEGGYRGSWTGRPGVDLDEASCYESLASEHGIRAALIVGYADRPWCADNNAWIAEQARTYRWARPLAYVSPEQGLDVASLERWQGEGFHGLSMYITAGQRARALVDVPDAVWGWLEDRRWLVSVNSQGELWRAWEGVLQRHGSLLLLASHLGLPQRVRRPPEPPQAAEALAPVLALAAYPGPRVKLSGFYALTDPGFEYPHRATWPYVRALLERFGAGRLLWASDYTPCLDNVSFPQTYALFGQMAFLGEAERRAIEGGNLLALLDEE
jgi:L-fuconolactonase